MSETYTQSTSLKSWAEDDRPREKLMLKGKAALSDAELLAIIMGSGNRNETAVDLAKRMLADVGNNWHQLARLGLSDLCKYKGIGEAKAIGIITALEIGSRKSLQLALEKPKITSSQKCFEVLQPYMADLNIEEFWAIFLNQKNDVISIEKQSVGGISGTAVDHRLLFKSALEKHATSIIIAHNHPSGNLKPSKSDKEITRLIKESGRILNIHLLDHLIISTTDYYSFADHEVL